VAQHISRKDLKKDEIREKFVHGVESVASHQQALWIVVGTALVLALAAFGWGSYARRQTAKAAEALDNAMQVFQARIRTPSEMPVADEISYLDDMNKYADAERKFLQVATDYGHTRPGQIARYYAALSEERLKRYDEAEKNLKQVEASGDQNLAGLARFQLAETYAQNGKGPQAVELYKRLVDKPTFFVPKSIVLLKLADYYSKTDSAQASKLYNQVKQDFPDTPAAEQADQGLELLNAKS
jgi:predicted negative regulator of RcsB-dependent stress response